MRKILFAAYGVMLFWFLASGPGVIEAFAAAPMRINFQGRLEESGEPASGIKSFVFKMYDAASGGTLVWTSETHNILVTEGLFSVVLETGTPAHLSTGTFAGPRFMEIAVDAVTLSPAEEIVSAPFALVSQALSSDAVVPLSVLEKDPSQPSTLNLSTNAVDWTQIKNMPADFADGFDDSAGSIVSREGGADKVNPTGALDFDAAQFEVTAVGSVAEIDLEASSVTLQGNTFNLAGRLLLLDGGGLVPLANLDASSVSLMGQQVESAEIADDTIADADVNSSAGISASKLEAAVMVEGEAVSLLANDAGYIAQSAAVKIQDSLQAGATFYVSSGTVQDLRVETAIDLPDDAIETADIGAGTLPADVLAQSLAPGAVGADAIGAGAVTDAKVSLSTAAVSSGKFSDDRVEVSTAAVASGRFPTSRLDDAVMEEGENVSLLANDAGYITEAAGIKLQETLQTGATFYVSSGTVDAFRVGSSIELPATSIANAALQGSVSVLGGSIESSEINIDADLDIGGNKLTNLADPTANQDAATKAYADGLRACPSDMVAVGAWCVDKYEGSVWATPTGGTQYGASTDDYPCSDNGTDCPAGAANPIYARSVSGVTPARQITWFQANIACTNVNKELLPNRIWQAAAAGTPDPGASGTAPDCMTASSNTGPGVTGTGTNCLSAYGAENMIGSLWEYVGEWGTAAAGVSNSTDNAIVEWDGAYSGYNNDVMKNVGGQVYTQYGSPVSLDWVTGMVTAVIRGGFWGEGTGAGVFALGALVSPSHWKYYIGFRCGRPR
ncbi:MAG: hypothetical protein ABII00_11790 [Elusimicrobiota bacterium]